MKTHLPTALAALALAISAGNAWHTRRALQRQQQAADFRWRHSRNNIATLNHRTQTNRRQVP